MIMKALRAGLSSSWGHMCPPPPCLSLPTSVLDRADSHHQLWRCQTPVGSHWPYYRHRKYKTECQSRQASGGIWRDWTPQKRGSKAHRKKVARENTWDEEDHTYHSGPYGPSTPELTRHIGVSPPRESQTIQKDTDVRSIEPVSVVTLVVLVQRMGTR